MNSWNSESFEAPSNRYRPRMRWWLPGAFMKDEEIKREIEWMVEAGYGGAEIIHFFPIPSADVNPADYGQYGFGSEEWNKRMKAALEVAIPLNFQLDFTVGPLWPIATPAVMDKNDVRCTHGLHVGTTFFKGGYVGAIPIPDTLEVERPYNLVAVTTARQSDVESVGKIMTLDMETAVDLTSNIEGDQIKWTAPGDGEWCLFSFWSQTNGQMNDSIAAPVIDHYSKPAAEAITGYWEERLFWNSDIRALYEKNAGSLFCDSIELNATMLGGMYGATPMAVAIWTPELLKEFRIRRGYDLTPYLPSIFVKGLYQLGAGSRTDGDSEYDFADRSANWSIRSDFFRTLTDMFRDNHLRTLRHWANGHSMKLRYQTYGMPTELTSGLREVDIPETESLGFEDSTDGYRLQSGAVHLYDKDIYSIEVGAVMGYGYKQTWTGMDQGLLWQLHRSLAAGVNQAVLHGMSYESESASLHFEAMFKWPGMSLMGAMFSNEWGARQPNSRHARILTDYISRNQYILQLGKPKIDLAIYRYHIDGIHHGMGKELTPYEQAGFTYDFVSPALLETPSAEVGLISDQPVLAADGPAYRAIVIDRRRNTDSGKWMPSALPAETADRLIDFAEKGLPIVIVGEAPSQVGSYNSSRKSWAARESEIHDRLAYLLNLPTVCQARHPQEAIEMLARLQVTPAAQNRGGPSLLSTRRDEEGIDYYYLYNSNVEESFEGEVLLKGEGTPFFLDAWDGTIRPLAAQRLDSGQVAVKLHLAPNATALIAIASVWKGELGAEPEKQEMVERITLNRWSLVVDSWTAGEHPTETKHERVDMELQELRSWTDIAELRYVSGIGRYRTSFRLITNPVEPYSVLLQLGDVSDTFRVIVNGQELPAANQIARRISIGRYLLQGEDNTLEVEVATTLNNALSVFDPNRQPQECGMRGPVEIVVSACTGREGEGEEEA